MSKALLDGFKHYNFPHAEMSHEVYSGGDGLPVIVLHELPGLGRAVVAFAHRLMEAGFQVHLPHLFGMVGKRQPLKNYRALCVSQEFAKSSGRHFGSRNMLAARTCETYQQGGFWLSCWCSWYVSYGSIRNTSCP